MRRRPYRTLRVLERLPPRRHDVATNHLPTREPTAPTQPRFSTTRRGPRSLRPRHAQLRRLRAQELDSSNTRRRLRRHERITCPRTETDAETVERIPRTAP